MSCSVAEFSLFSLYLQSQYYVPQFCPVPASSPGIQAVLTAMQRIRGVGRKTVQHTGLYLFHNNIFKFSVTDHQLCAPFVSY